MNFDYNEEQQLLADSVRRFVGRDYDFEKRRAIVHGAGMSEEVWAAFAEMGLLGIPLPVEYGGFGGGAVDLLAVMESFGEALVVEPYLATVGLGAPLVARGGSAAQKAAILPAVAQGRMKLAFAHTERGARYDLDHVEAKAERTGTGWRLSGEKCVALGAPHADRIVVSARSAKGITLFLVAPGAKGLALRACRTLDGMRAADLVLDGVSEVELLGDEDPFPLAALEEVMDFATALVCAEAVGAMDFANRTTLEYLKTRRQFGVPIGAFQALQHRMVDMFVAAEQARSMACLACARVDAAADAKARMRAVSAAKIRIADAARQISQESVQLHGGMGMTEEMKVSHTFRRLTMIAQQFGDADCHLDRFSRLD